MATPAATQIVDETADLQLEDLIADEQVAVTVSNAPALPQAHSYIHLPAAAARGGTGRIGMKTRDEDFRRPAYRRFHPLLPALLHQLRPCLLAQGLRSSRRRDRRQGQGHGLARCALSRAKKSSLSCPLTTSRKTARISSSPPVTAPSRRLRFKDFSNVQSRGIIAIGIDKDDELITARITDGHQVIFLATHDGMAIRFDETGFAADGPACLRQPAACKPAEGDYLVGAAVTPFA